MVDLKFDYRFASEEFFTEEVKTALETAGKIWSDLLQDDFEDIPAGVEFTIQNPETGADETITLEQPIDDLLIFVGAADTPFNGEGDSTRGLEGGDAHLLGCCCIHCHTAPKNNGDLSELGILSNSTDNLSLLAQAKVDGTDLVGDKFQSRISSDFRGTGAVSDFEPWAGVISFATGLPNDAEWDFSLNNPDPDKFDFITVALHEIGHILGIGVAPTFIDLIQNGSFEGFNAKNVNNDLGIPLESDFGHVEEGFANNSVLLDSVLGDGRVEPTNFDLALLADIGYEVDGFTKQGFVPEIATEGDETIIGALVDDVIDGLGGNDQIQGQDGDDAIDGGTGDDTLFGSLGQDYILGNEGDDQIQGNRGNDTIEGGAGNDSISGNPDNDLIFGNSGNDTLEGGIGDDTIRGNDDDDLIFGQEGRDFILGNSGEDELQGGEDEDSLRGGDASDLLFGQDGDDTLEGGIGDDTLEGGAGKDRFDFGFNFGNDIINDYVLAEDSLVFSAQYDFETQSYDITDANQIIDSITSTGNSSNSEQIFSEITPKEDNTVLIFHDEPLTVDEIEIYFPFQFFFTQTKNGFELEFNKSLNTRVLNLYQRDNENPDLSFTRNSTGENVDGSLVWNESSRTLTFVKTDGILEADTYSLSLFSRENGFVSSEGELLDGDSDGIEGDNFFLEFEVTPNQQRILSIEDISRGVGQTIANPNTNDSLIVSLNNGSGITQIDLSLTYNPDILNLENIILDPNIGSDWTIIPNLDTPGSVEVSLQGTTALNSGAIDLFHLQGTVNESATYGTSTLLGLENISLNEGNIDAVGDNGLLKVTNLGDADGDENYSNFDAALISEMAAGIRDSLDNFSTTDSIIVGDVNQDGVISAFDAYIVNQEANGVDTGFLF